MVTDNLTPSPPPTRLAGADLDTTGVDDTACCYAEKTETWLDAPDGIRFEWYVKTGDSEQFANVVLGQHPDPASCCG